MARHFQDFPKQPPLPYQVEVVTNPSQEQLRLLALEFTPHCFRTESGSICKVSRNKARMAKFTYVIDRQNDSSLYSHSTIDSKSAQVLIDGQAEYIRSKGKLIAIEGYIGVGPRAVACQWCYTLEGANIAGMQQILTFSREAVEDESQQNQPFSPTLRLIYTPDYRPEIAGKQAVVVDLENNITYVMGADYFGESKKGALRMLSALVHQQGGLLMHSGAKVISTGGDRSDLTMGILGLSGTGKTTTTFSKQGTQCKPLQDDMVAIWPNGEVSVTENGCFAKTFDLTVESEPTIYRGTCDGSAWIENVYLDESNRPVFGKRLLSQPEVERMREVLVGTGAPSENVEAYISGKVAADSVLKNGVPDDGWDFIMWTENGRSIIPMSVVEDAADLEQVPPLRSLGILNRDEGEDAAMPALLRFTTPEQAAGYMMLGETTKTSAAGKDRGKTRSPFTQPFFPLAHRLQAQRFSELAQSFAKTTMWLMNTGFVAGDAIRVEQGKGLKVKIRHSSACLEALLEEKILWKVDPDFGYEIVDVDAPENAELLNKVPKELLQPKLWFEQHGRMDDYQRWIAEIKAARTAFLRKFAIAEAIIDAVAHSQPA